MTEEDQGASAVPADRVTDATHGASKLSPPCGSVPTSAAARDVLAERQRQIAAEGWSLEHDDKHHRGALAMAAALYATPRPLHEVEAWEGGVRWRDPWPWFHSEYAGREQGDDPPSLKVLDGDGRQTHDRRRRLVIAGALIVAEIERLDRATGASK